MDTQQLISLMDKALTQNSELIAQNSKMLQIIMQGQSNFAPPSPPLASRPQYGRKKTVRSHTDPSVSYVVTTYPGGTKTCTCPHHKYRKVPCKHM